MGLRGLLGHEYANREVEREREERGNEVVVTYRTVETCDRCGERRVVSENKEVRPVRNPDSETVTTGLGGDGSVTPDLGEESADAPDTETPDAEPDAPAEPAESDAPGEPPVDASEASETDETEPETADDDVDDAIILDDGPDESTGDRGHGEWPDADEEEATEEADPEPKTDPTDPSTVDDGATVVTGEGWPETEGEDEGFDAEPSGGEPTEVSFGGGLAPEDGDATNGTDAGAARGTAESGTPGGATGKQFVAAAEVERVSTDDTGETEFFCPNCGHARAAGGSSMRAGDICPECHKGYIAERER